MVFDFFKGATKEGYLSNSEEEGMDASLQKRIKRTLYGGVKVPECFNLGFSDIAVDYFQEAVPRNLRDLQRGFPAPLAQHACVSPCSVLLSMIYTKRLRQKNPEYLLQISSSDLFFISMMVASKYLYNEDEDDDVLVDEWAEDMDREKDEVIELERSFLAAIEWHLFVKQDEFEATLKDMERQMALRAGLDRGWLTYNELQLLAPSPAQLVWSQVGTHWVQVVVVSSVAYLAGVMTMVGSTALAIHSPALASSAAMAMSASLPALREGLHQLPVFGSGPKSPPPPSPSLHFRLHRSLRFTSLSLRKEAGKTSGRQPLRILPGEVLMPGKKKMMMESTCHQSVCQMLQVRMALGTAAVPGSLANVAPQGGSRR